MNEYYIKIKKNKLIFKKNRKIEKKNKKEKKRKKEKLNIILYIFFLF